MEHVSSSFFPLFLSLFSCFLINFVKVTVPLSGGEVVLLSFYSDMPLFYLHLCIGICYSNPAEMSSFSV